MHIIQVAINVLFLYANIIVTVNRIMNIKGINTYCKSFNISKDIPPLNINIWKLVDINFSYLM